MKFKTYANKYTGKEVEAIQFVSKDRYNSKENVNNFLDIQKFCRDKLRYEMTYEEIGDFLVSDLEPGAWLVSGHDTRWCFGDREFIREFQEKLDRCVMGPGAGNEK